MCLFVKFIGVVFKKGICASEICVKCGEFFVFIKKCFKFAGFKEIKMRKIGDDDEFKGRIWAYGIFKAPPPSVFRCLK